MNKRINLLASLLASLGAGFLAASSPASAATTPTSAATMSAPVAETAQSRAALLAQLEARRAERGLDARHGFAIVSQHPGVQGTQVARVAHTFKGVRVFGAESVVVLDTGGRIQSESASDRRLGLSKANSAGMVGSGTGPGNDFSVIPTISSKAAIDAALASLGKEARHVAPPSAELIIYPVMRTERTQGAAGKPEQELNALDVQEVVDHYELAYLVHTRMHVGEKPVYHDTVVSARDGSILDQWSMLQTVVGVGKSQYNGEVPVNTTLVDG